MGPGTTLTIHKDDNIYFGLVVDIDNDNFIVSVPTLNEVFIVDKKGNYISTYKGK